jgi:GGDEF domain-containing protein
VADEVVAAADAAMYDAKRLGGGYALFSAHRHGRRGGSSG